MANGWETIATQLQEALKLSHGDVAKALDSHLETQFPGQYSHVMDVFGDAESGDVVYHQAGKMQKAPYSVTKADGKHTATIDHKAAKQVTARTVYESEQQEAADLDISTEFVPLKEGAVGQDGSAFLKLIQPGWGSSGYYSPEVLERDGPKVFKAGLKSYWNHQTDAQERERPEGDLRDLASVLTEDAKYMANGPAGAGLYAKAKVMPHFREHVDALAPHIGMSIRANGRAKEGQAEGRKGPIIEQLTHGKSVDYVTTPGAGGKILQLFEAARSRPIKESKGAVMDDAQLKELKESNDQLRASNALIAKRLMKADAKEAAAAQLSAVSLPKAARQRIIERSVAGNLPEKDGDLDAVAFKTVVEAELKTEAAYLKEVNPGLAVTGMGAAPQIAELTEAQRVEREKQRDRSVKEAAGLYGVRTEAGVNILRDGRSAFNPEYNSRVA